jgi:hypothetical protein
MDTFSAQCTIETFNTSVTEVAHFFCEIFMSPIGKGNLGKRSTILRRNGGPSGRFKE